MKVEHPDGEEKERPIHTNTPYVELKSQLCHCFLMENYKNDHGVIFCVFIYHSLSLLLLLQFGTHKM